MTEDIAFLSLLDVAERIRGRKISSEAVTRTLLDRIARFDDKLHSFTFMMTESALAEAAQADREIQAGFYRGPLQGVPVAVKDLLFTKGVPTGAGMELFSGFKPDFDATVVERLRRAGAVILGKLHMTEGATVEHHPSLPRPNNPWRDGYFPGGSSSGSGVAVAAGFCYGALGTDTGGSIRIPSASCGLSGIKPTWGRVSRHGLFPLSESLDHIGPMTRSAADAAAILGVIAGADPLDPTALGEPVPNYLRSLDDGIEGIRIGVDWAFATENVDPATAAAIHEAAALFPVLGARIVPVTLPSTKTLADDFIALLVPEAAYSHRATFPAQADRYGPGLRHMLEGAAHFGTADMVRAQQARAAFAGRLAALFREVDLILLPTMPSTAFSWAEIDAMGPDFNALMMDRLGRFTLMFNMACSPTLTLPSGFDAGGLPTSLQLAGPRLAEPLLCRAGFAFQRMTDFHTRHPTLA